MNRLCLITNDVETTSIVNHRLSDETGRYVLEQGMPRLLDLYERYGVKATFFFTGHIARINPQLVRMAQEQGHEVGSHGLTHEVSKAFDAMPRDEQLSHLKQSKQILEDITGTPVVSFRALPRVAGNWLTLTINKDETDISDPVCEEEFASRILSFVRTDGDTRAEIIADPWAWAEKVIAMSGDKVSDIRSYPVIAELCLVNRLREAGLLTDVANQYRGPDAGIHDFELPAFSLECKAHLHGDSEAKKGELVISSENQLSLTGQKPLYLAYCPMEASGDLSIDSCVAAFGEPRSEIMEKVALCGFVEGDFSWMRPYHAVAEPLVFEINDSFPRITPAQFPDGRFPSGITKLAYSVSLKNLPSCPLNMFIEAMQNGKPPTFEV